MEENSNGLNEEEMKNPEENQEEIEKAPDQDGTVSKAVADAKPRVRASIFVKARKIRPENAAGFLYWAKKKYGDQHKETIPDWLTLFEEFNCTPMGRR